MEYPDRFIRRVVVTIAIVGAVFIAWQVRAVVMIIFGGMIIATLLTAAANCIERVVSLKRKTSVAIAIVIIVGIFVGSGWWIGGNIADQLTQLREKLPEAIDAFMNWLDQVPFAAGILDQQADSEGMDVPLERIAGMTGTALGAVANIVLILAIGVYLAATPGVYRRGLISLIPPAYQARTDEAFVRAAIGLRQWLVGQLITMAIVGTLIAIGLKFLDMPLALSLGLIAGLLEFIPFIGPLAFGVLAVMLAFMEGPAAALHVAILCLIVQQLESNVITPLVQRRTVKLPPALGLIGMLIFGGLFGIFGILFATPLMVVVMILIKRLYVEGALQGQTAVKNEAPPAPNHDESASCAKGE